MPDVVVAWIEMALLFAAVTRFQFNAYRSRFGCAMLPLAAAALAGGTWVILRLHSQPDTAVPQVLVVTICVLALLGKHRQSSNARW